MPPISPAEEAIAMTVDSHDEHYTDQYLAEAMHYLKAGIYDKIAEQLSLPNGSTHIDFGCGQGFLLHALRKRNPNVAYLGIEYNLHMIMKAVRHLAELNVPSRPHAEGYMKFENDMMEWEYPLDFAENPNLFRPGGPIRLIHADMRREELLQKLIGDRMIDSATLTFHGASGSSAFENEEQPRHLIECMDCFRKKMFQLMLEMRMTVHQFMSENTREGGEIVMVERDNGYVDIPESLDRVGKCKKYWEPQDPEIVSVELNGLSSGFMHHGQTPEGGLKDIEFSPSGKKQAIIQKFTRNDIPYTHTTPS
jgi:hypothetical protein